MSGADNIVVETTERIFRDLADPQTVNSADDDTWREPLWNALEDAGLTVAWLADDLGGAGASVADGFAVTRVSGNYAAPVPVAETLLAAWLLGRAGLSAPRGPMTVAPMRDQDHMSLQDKDRLSGVARSVPWAQSAEHIALLVEHDGQCSVALVDRNACTLLPGSNLAGDPRDEVRLDGVTARHIAPAPPGLDRRALSLMGAAVRATQMTGALEAILNLSVDYAGERVAFERKISKFQAVQHELAKLASETAAAIAASGAAAAAVGSAETFDDRTFLEVASAKVRVGEAAREGAAIAHQVHGAIGFTEEYILHRFTRRLWSWQDDFGSESVWAAQIGAMICAGGPDQLWSTITAA